MKRKQAQKKPEENQETQNLTQTASPLQPPETDDRNTEQTVSVDNFYFIPGANQNDDVTIYDPKIESSQTRESPTFNADNSRVLEINPSTRPTIPRRRLRILRNSSIYPSQQV